MPSAVDPQSSSNGTASAQAAPEPKKLVLCFDGTGNTFSGSNADTNVVKILHKLDRNDPNQFHYYQTGIGTYDINDQSVQKGFIGNIRSSISQTIDQGIGTTFDAHVMAGYRFLMKYYDSGDKIYMFGFSRGAFTAKFLARMIRTVGLLCKGNEEMVLFVYRLYLKYLEGEVQNFVNHPKPPKRPTNGNTDAGELPPGDHEHEGAGKHKHKVARDEITAFSNTFCRKDTTYENGKKVETGIKVYFLGIWDCVNSVAILEGSTPVPVPVKGTAHYVRHAVAVDERRVKFKAALLAQDIRHAAVDDEDIKEVWFPGCHGDVGGGWPAVEGQPLDNNKRMTVWQRVKNFWTSRKPGEPSSDVCNDPFQMSDIPLAWMIRELELVGQQDPRAAVKWRKTAKGFKRRFQQKKQQALKGFIHDSLSFGYGTGFVKVLFWKFMEVLPIITRWELEKNEWKNVRFPLNKGSARDIPTDAVLHESVLWRLKNDPSYNPRNNHGGWMKPCLKHHSRICEVEPVLEAEGLSDPDHQTYRIAKSAGQE